ncbi:flagellar basal-body rod protein FlgF [Frateuria aurantia]
MDRSLYISMTGAAQLTRLQDEVASNLANASTTGFKSELSAMTSVPVLGDGESSRANVVAKGLGQDFSEGAQTTTGRDLDIAVKGSGWIAVQSPTGGEAYTRAGNLQITSAGLLTDAQGNPVASASGGTITVPESHRITIGADGTLSAVSLGQEPNSVGQMGQIKLVNPDTAQLVLQSDGLMHMKDGTQAAEDPAVTVDAGVLESSNVNPSTELVSMISISRQFDMQMQSIKNADTNEQSTLELLQDS